MERLKWIIQQYKNWFVYRLVFSFNGVQPFRL
jgi:hypothetical protein